MRSAIALVSLAVSLSAQLRTPYVEDFTSGPGGWVANRYEPLVIRDGVAYLFGPWYLDSHHAPPGAGYLHMLMYCTLTPPASTRNSAAPTGSWI